MAALPVPVQAVAGLLPEKQLLFNDNAPVTFNCNRGIVVEHRNEKETKDEIL